MRHLSLVATVALLWLLLLALPVSAAELTGGCTLEARSFDAAGAALDTGVAPPGAEGTASNPFRVDWDGVIDFRFTTGGTVYQNNQWAIYAQLIPFPFIAGSDDNPSDLDESGELTIPDGVPGPMVGLFYVSGWLEGNNGANRCDGSGWVHVVGNPLSSPIFWVAVALLVLGGALLVATPYTGTWEQTGYSPMPTGPLDNQEVG